MEPQPKLNEQDTVEGVDESDQDLKFPKEMSMQEKVQRLVRITKNQRMKINARDEIIKDLVDQIGRRDRILELSSNPEDKVQVVKMGGDEEGRSFYEIRNKQQIPYLLKTERLSPTPMQIDLEKLNEPEILQGEEECSVLAMNMGTEKKMVKVANPTKSKQRQNVQNKEFSVEGSSTILKVGEEDLDHILSPDLEIEDGELSEEQTEEQICKEAIKSKLKSSDEPSQTPKSKKRPKDLGEDDVDTQPPEKNARSDTENLRHPPQSIKVSISRGVPGRMITVEENLERSPSLLPTPRQKSRSPTSCDNNVHRQSIFQADTDRSPEGQSYRPRFIFADDVDSSLSDFWCCGQNASNIKYLIKLQPGENCDWDRQRFTIIEQNDLDPFDPKVTIMNQKLVDIERKIESDFPGKTRTIWLELADFPILSHSFPPYCSLNRIGEFITHLTLGHRLYSHRYTKNSKIESNLLLEFIFKYFPALQFLAISSDSLDFSDDKIPLGQYQSKCFLNSLKVLKFLRSKTPDKREQKSSPGFSVDFFQKIWRRSPNIKRLYGIPLRILGKIGAAAKFQVRSICVASVQQQFITGYSYHEQLKIVQNFWKQLEELDTRIFFIPPQKQQLRVSIMRTLSQILEKNAETLKKVKVEVGPKGPFSWLKFPICKNVTTLTFSVHTESSHLVFPFWDETEFAINFPNLKKLKICGANKNYISELNAGIFEFDKCFPTRVFSRVESLFLKNVGGAEFLIKTIKLFSNARFLRLQYRLKDVNKVLPVVFEYMQKLEQMQIEVNTDGGLSLDTGLTGIEPAGLKKLKMDLWFGSCVGQEELFKRAEKLRTSRSMLQLPGLSFLRIVFRPGTDPSFASNPILSPVSAYFGFGFKWTKLGLEAPKILVQIGFNEAFSVEDKETILASLEPMLPFVTLES